MQRFRTLIVWLALFALSASCFAGQVPHTFFGMSFNMTQTPWQVAPGTIRLWDSGVAWVWMNPSPGQYTWTTFDTWLSIAKQRHVDVIYTFGRTPQWASSNPNDSTCAYGPGQCNFPSNIKYWDDFVSAIIKHAQAWNQANGNSVNVYWETWNEPNAPTWHGTYAQMVQLEQDLFNIAHSIDSSAVVLSPCPQGSHSYSWMQSFLAAGGGPFNDVLAFHGYLGSTNGLANPVENLLGVVGSMRSVMSQYGQSGKQLWDTEYAWDSGDDTAMPNLDDRANYLVKSYVLHWSLGIQRLVWYMYENKYNGTLYSSTTGLQPGGVAFNNISQWLLGAQMNSPCSADANATYSCAFVDSSGRDMLVAWNSKTTASLDASPYQQYLDIYGGTHSIPSAGLISIGKAPIFLMGGSVSTPPPTAVLSVTPSSGLAPLAVTADASASHDAQGRSVARSSINFGDGASAAGPLASHTYSSTGTFTVTLTVWDANNLSSSATAQVSVSSSSQPLSAALHVTPTSGPAPTTVSATATALTGTISSSVINFGDGTVVSGTSASHTYKSVGKFTVTATVRNSQGVSASTTAQVTISAVPPVAVLQVTPQSGKAPLLVTASAAGSSDPGGSSLSSTLDFGDGTTAPGPTASHKYHQAGVYTVTATVRNSYGSTASATAQVTISAARSDFKVDATPSSLGSSAYTYQLTITADSTLYSPVFLSCIQAPAGASCSFSPPVVVPGKLPVRSVLTVRMPKTLSAQAAQSLPMLALWLPLPGLALLGAGFERKSGRRRWTAVLLGGLLLTLLLLTGCGGGDFSPSTSSTTANSADAVTVLAKSATGTHTVTIYLPVSTSGRRRR
jgi:PKD repeat protein